jgi:hypothetical protein
MRACRSLWTTGGSVIQNEHPMKIFTILALFAFLAASARSQTQSDTIFNYKTKTPVVVDGQDTEECWADAEWHAIDQVWIPYNAVMDYGDFEGYFKVSWDEEYLYVLVEVTDDSLSDDHPDPFTNWWDDDCLEVFIDEDRSMGDHERNCNAFAYHVSLTYDALDLNAYGQGINYRDNLEVDMEPIGEDTYLWEFAIKNYDATFNPANPEASRVLLEAGKLMGFAIAYCDNDETTSRENFIGSMYMTQSTANDMYRNADHFGPMLLIDPDSPSSVAANKGMEDCRIYPVPARDFIRVETTRANRIMRSFSISTLAGQVVSSGSVPGTSHTIHMEHLDAGIYLLEIDLGHASHRQLIVKQ